MVRILTYEEQINKVEFTKEQPSFSRREKIDPSKEFKNRLIVDIIKKTLIELAVSLAFAGAACFFVATPVGMATLLICAVAAVAINVLLRSAAAYCMIRVKQLQYCYDPEDQEKRALFCKVLGFLQYLVPTIFSTMVDANTREVIVHEAGHALAASVLVKNPRIHVTVNPLQGGQTSYRISALTQIGEFFGRAKSKLIVAAAGPALSIVTASAALGGSLAVRKSNPELSRYLRVIAIDSVVQHVFYALSALWVSATQKGHDFIQLMAAGVHPIVSVISILALPIIVRVGFFIYDKVKEKAAERAAARDALHHNKHYMIE